MLTSSASRLNGGVFEAVVLQADLLRRMGALPVVLALEDAYSQADRHRLGDTEVMLGKVLGPPQIGYSPDLPRLLLAANLDLLHLHGIWMYPSRSAAQWARRTGKPYIISPHGMLDPWITGRGKAKKALARAGYERASWKAATFFHALTGREAGDIARESGRSDAVVIPNPGPPVTEQPVAQRPFTFGYIGRIHPKKNLAPLVAAWSSLTASGALPQGASLRIAGWGAEEDVDALKAQIAASAGDIAFLGPVFGAAKEELINTSRFIVLPSLSEGLPMAMLEAWSAGTPVLMTQECNLPDGFAAGAALDCGYDSDSIGRCIGQAVTMPEGQWQAMSAAALDLARTSYSEERVSDLWRQAYLAAIRQGTNR